jgi:hypothetical protein
MTRRKAVLEILALAAALFTVGCGGPKQMYTWHAYDDVLYAHYKSPQDHANHIERMREIVTETEAAGLKMPPGVYAEYGYAIFEEGRFDESVMYFKKEKETWPESVVIMDNVIRNVARLRENRSRASGGGSSAASAAGGSTR